MLVNAGADANVNNLNGETALFMAAQQGYAEVVSEFLRDGGSVTEENRTSARDIAARKGHQEVVNSIPMSVNSGDGAVDKLSNTLHTTTINA